jgi:ribose 5-phosphate isomerase B
VKVVVATDEDRAVVDFLVGELRARGLEVERLPQGPWGEVALAAAQRVARGDAAQAIVCCWTGTGVTLAANKVPGVRAALCVDAETARGARVWNDANVLGLSLRLLSEPVAKEILDAWCGAGYGGTEDASLAVVASTERR